jgi:hypothetical protein
MRRHSEHTATVYRGAGGRGADRRLGRAGARVGHPAAAEVVGSGEGADRVGGTAIRSRLAGSCPAPWPASESADAVARTAPGCGEEGDRAGSRFTAGESRAGCTSARSVCTTRSFQCERSEVGNHRDGVLRRLARAHTRFPAGYALRMDSGERSWMRWAWCTRRSSNQQHRVMRRTSVF